jgi:hypothetical protein
MPFASETTIALDASMYARDGARSVAIVGRITQKGKFNRNWRRVKMCDCYFHKCEECDNQISTHIADFCVPREDVHVLCPKCIKREQYEEQRYVGIFAAKIWICVCEYNNQIQNKDGKAVGRKGQVVVFWSTNAIAYGVNLN